MFTNKNSDGFEFLQVGNFQAKISYLQHVTIQTTKEVTTERTL